MVAPRPGAGNGTASNPMVDERKGEHGGKEEWLRSGGQKADSGRSALASSAGERDDREAGAVTGVPPGIVGTSVNSAPEESPDRSRQRTGDDRRRAGRGRRCARTEAVCPLRRLAAARTVGGLSAPPRLLLFRIN